MRRILLRGDGDPTSTTPHQPNPRPHPSPLTARVPHVALVRGQLPPQPLLDVREGVELGGEQFPKEGDVGDGQTEGVDLAEALLVGEGRHTCPQLLER